MRSAAWNEIPCTHAMCTFAGLMGLFCSMCCSYLSAHGGRVYGQVFMENMYEQNTLEPKQVFIKPEHKYLFWIREIMDKQELLGMRHILNESRWKIRRAITLQHELTNILKTYIENICIYMKISKIYLLIKTSKLNKHIFPICNRQTNCIENMKTYLQ